MSAITPPFPIFTDLDGEPLEAGYIWIGVENLPPQTNPEPIYWDEALTQPAAQPVRTQGGYIVNAGTPARLYVADQYSILVQNKNGTAVYSSLQGNDLAAVDVSKASGGTVQDTVTLVESVVYKPDQTIFEDSLAYGNGLRLLVDAGSNTGHFNTAVGIDALLSATTPYGNTAVGSGALRSTTTGYDNTAVGYEPLINNVDGYNNTGIAPKALYSNTSGYRNVAVGTTALFTNVSGFENVAIGVDALFASTGSGNTVGGYAAGSKVTTGARNTAWGYKALGNAAATTTGNDNTAVGYRALFSLTSGLDNQAFGRDALVSLTTGNNNVAVGRDSLTNVISGGDNVGVGVGALQLATSSNNVAVGTSSLDALTSGTNCTAVGHQSGTNATGNGQTLIGYQAGLNVSNGSNNTVLGASTGTTITSGGNNTLIGYTADGIATGDNQTAVGNGATCTASNQITLGNASVSALRCQVTTITALSDARDKADIQDLALGLEFINAVRPVRFTWATRDGAKVGIPEAGFIAQELRDAASAAGAEWVGLVDETNPDRLEAAPGKLLPILIRAVQELAARVAELEARRD